jgi:hypothetical protein
MGAYMPDQQIKTERSYLMVIFGLPFFLVGVGFLFWSILPTLYDVWRMQEWLPVDGKLLHADLVTSHSDGSTTYRAEARYTYDVLGRQFWHDRIAINSGADNIGDFQEKLGRQLQALQRRSETVVVYYNPADPQDAVLNRDARWGLLGFKLIFVLLFGGVGAGIVYWGLRGKRIIHTPEAKEKPWLSRPEWHDGRIRSGAKGGMYGIWGFATFWNLISLPAAFQFMDVWYKEGWIALVILLFPLVGAGLIYWAIKLTREWARFGTTPLTMDPFPGAIGGDVGGVIELNEPFRPGMACRVTLSNILSYVSGSGKNRSRGEDVKWQDEGYARALPQAQGTALQFRFKVPPGLDETEEASNRYHFWRLNVELELDGVDLDRSFEIPVYNTAESSRQIDFLSPAEQPDGLPRMTAESLLPITQQGNSRQLYYRILRKPGRSITMLVFGSVFAVIGVFLWGEAASEGFMLYLMSTVFSLVGVGIVLMSVYSAFNSLKVILDGHNIITTRSLFGIPVSHHEFHYADVLAVRSRQGMKSNSGNRHTIEYRIEAKLPGKQITLAEQLDSASKADRVVEYFENELLRAGPTFELGE